MRVTGVSGKPEGNQFLTGLGATGAIGRDQAIDTSGRPMLKARWAGVIDTVGGDILATAIKSTHPWGTVTCCGMAASADLPLNVFPFILRGVRLIGIDSQNCPMPLRRSVWDKLAAQWKPDCLDQLIREVPLAQLDPQIDLILKGKQKGRGHRQPRVADIGRKPAVLSSGLNGHRFQPAADRCSGT